MDPTSVFTHLFSRDIILANHDEHESRSSSQQALLKDITMSLFRLDL